MGLIKGDTRSLDNGSHEFAHFPLSYGTVVGAQGWFEAGSLPRLAGASSLKLIWNLEGFL